MALPHGPGAARGAWRARRGSLSLLSSLEVPTGRGRRAAVCARVVDTRIWRMAGTNQLELVVVKVFVSSRVPLCICAGGRVCLCVSVCVPRHPRAHRIHTACVLFFVCWFVAGKSGRVVQRARSRAVWVRRSHRASLDRPPRPGPCALHRWRSVGRWRCRRAPEPSDRGLRDLRSFRGQHDHNNCNNCQFTT